MNQNDNTDRSHGRRDEDAIPVGRLDCTDIDAIASGYLANDPAAIRILSDHLLTVEPQHHRETLAFLLDLGREIGGES